MVAENPLEPLEPQFGFNCSPSAGCLFTFIGQTWERYQTSVLTLGRNMVKLTSVEPFLPVFELLTSTHGAGVDLSFAEFL